MRQLFQIIRTILQWTAVVLLVLFFGPTTTLIGQFDKKTKKWCARWYRYFCKAILFATGIKVAVIGRERIDRDRNYLVCSNHQGLLDILTMGAALPLPLLFVSKPAYFKIPIVGQGMRASGHLEVKRTDTEHDKKVMEQLAQYLVEGRNYVMYPEGTRSRDGSIAPFKMGAFHAATQAQVSILPITIIGSREHMPRGTKMVIPGTIRMIVGKPIEAGVVSPEELRDQVREVIVSQYERYAVPYE